MGFKKVRDESMVKTLRGNRKYKDITKRLSFFGRYQVILVRYIIPCPWCFDHLNPDYHCTVPIYKQPTRRASLVPNQ